MSETNHPEASGAESTAARSEAVLRFSCMNCGMELTAPLSAAGVEGPCPVCGMRTKAPMMRGGDETEPQAIPPTQSQSSRGADERPVSPEPETGPQAPVACPANGMTGSAATPAAPSVGPSSQEGRAAPPPPAPVSSRSGRSPEGSGRRRVKRVIDPSTGYSSAYEDRKELGELVRIVLAVLVTAAITFGVFHIVKRKFYGPLPEPGIKFPSDH